MLFRIFFTLQGKYYARKTFFCHQSQSLFSQPIRRKTSATCALANAIFPARNTDHKCSRAYHPLQISRSWRRLNLFAALANTGYMCCSEVLKAKFVRQPCVLPVACPAALCDLCLQFVFLWPFHQPNSYDFQRPEKPQGQCIFKLQLKPFRTKHIDASKLMVSSGWQY